MDRFECPGLSVLDVSLVGCTSAVRTGDRKSKETLLEDFMIIGDISDDSP